jgi:hypothetical protein
MLAVEVHEKLLPISSAKYNSKDARLGCLKDTRTSVLQELSTWANDDTPRLSTLWLNGMAGTGKSAISSTFAKDMDENGLLGASFFVDRQIADRRDPHRIVHSLAYDLAVHDYGRLRALWSSLCADPTIKEMQLKDQIKKLIQTPLNAACSQPLVILIDGLNECTPSDGARLLSTLAACLSDLPIRLLIASRRDLDIADTFSDMDPIEIRLQERPSHEVSRDVRRYWEHSLESLRVNCRPVKWRSLVSLDLLVDLTGPLFIYATTIIRIIEKARSNPIQKLQELLANAHSGIASTNEVVELPRRNALEELYYQILRGAVDDDGTVSPAYARQLHKILEVVIFARVPLTPVALSDLVSIDEDELHVYLGTLSSVLFVPDHTDAHGVIRPVHQSFPNFVLQQGGIVHSKLTMHAALAHKNLAEHCLFQLNKLLHYNMCNLNCASLFNHEVLDLQTRLDKHISTALRYSCRYWMAHWVEHLKTAVSQPQVPLGLDEFCGQHLLHWIEVLSPCGSRKRSNNGLLGG